MNDSGNNSWGRCLAGGAVMLGLFFGLGKLLTLVGPSAHLDGPLARQIALKLSMIVAAMLVWLGSRRPWAEMGWRRPQWRNKNWWWIGAACMSMAAASVFMILSDNRHPLLSQMNILQIIPVVWGLSSVSEEIFVRGAFQSWCDPNAAASEPAVAGKRLALTPPVVSSAMLFASMHVPLIWMGSGALGGSIIVAATLVVGWACAYLRASTGSLWIAIAVHIAGNVAAVPGGIVGAIAYRVIHGHFPQ